MRVLCSSRSKIPVSVTQLLAYCKTLWIYSKKVCSDMPAKRLTLNTPAKQKNAMYKLMHDTEQPQARGARSHVLERVAAHSLAAQGRPS